MAASNLSQQRIINPILTTLVKGYKQDNLVHEEVLRVIPVPLEGGTIQTFGKEAFQIPNTLRAIGTKSNRVNDAVSSVTYKLDEQSLEAAIDDRERKNNPDPAMMEKRRVTRRQAQVQLGREKAAANLLTNTASWDAGNTLTLVGNAQWSSATSAPVDAINAAKEVVRKKIGVIPNTLLLGPQPKIALARHKQIRGYLASTERGIVNEKLLADILELDTVITGRASYADASGTKFNVWDDMALLCYVCPKGQEGDDSPSVGYTLMLEGYPAVEEYRDNSAKSDVYVYAEIYKHLVLSSEAGFLWSDVTTGI